MVSKEILIFPQLTKNKEDFNVFLLNQNIWFDAVWPSRIILKKSTDDAVE